MQIPITILILCLGLLIHPATSNSQLDDTINYTILNTAQILPKMQGEILCAFHSWAFYDNNHDTDRPLIPESMIIQELNRLDILKSTPYSSIQFNEIWNGVTRRLALPHEYSVKMIQVKDHGRMFTSTITPKISIACKATRIVREWLVIYGRDWFYYLALFAMLGCVGAAVLFTALEGKKSKDNVENEIARKLLARLKTRATNGDPGISLTDLSKVIKDKKMRVNVVEKLATSGKVRVNMSVVEGKGPVEVLEYVV